ncbi:S-4TM family putative pore-forming effector [Pseudoxanthomonas sp. LARHCG66]
MPGQSRIYAQGAEFPSDLCAAQNLIGNSQDKPYDQGPWETGTRDINAITDEPKNEISARQNTPEMLKILWARNRVFARIKHVQAWYFGFTFALPTASLLVSLYFAPLKPWVSLLALTVGAIDALAFDVWRKKMIKIAARLQEQFDCYVLGMKWNAFTAGTQISPQDIEEYAHPPLDAESRTKLVDWYPAQACAMPLHVARLVCQRTNLWYDSKVRSTYRAVLWSIAGAYFLVLLMFFLHTTLIEVLLGLLIPFGPFFTWVARENQRQADTIKLVDRLLGEIDKSLDTFVEAKRTGKADARARELQDAIFSHRASSPLVSDLIYKIKRPKLEVKMKAGADAFVTRVNKAIRN